MTNTEMQILRVLDEHKEIQGTEQLERLVNVSYHHHILTSAVLLAKAGLISIEKSLGGRGNKTIYRSNNDLFTVRRNGS